MGGKIINALSFSTHERNRGSVKNCSVRAAVGAMVRKGRLG
jgi:hypothetical protein